MKHVLIGTDEGLLFILSVDKWFPQQIASLSSPIYTISEGIDENLVLGLGNGVLVYCSTQISPGQEVVILKEQMRRTGHQGSVFGIQIVPKAVLSVGADGRFVVSYSTGRRKPSEPSLSNGAQALWAIAAINDERYLIATNDGSLIYSSNTSQIHARRIHKSSIRHVEVSPRKLWCVTVGKDKCVYATTVDLSYSKLLHITKDYGYSAKFSLRGDEVIICDGAGEITIIKFDRPIDDLTSNQLGAQIR